MNNIPGEKKITQDLILPVYNFLNKICPYKTHKISCRLVVCFSERTWELNPNPPKNPKKTRKNQNEMKMKLNENQNENPNQNEKTLIKNM